MSKTPEHRIWLGIRVRCLSPEYSQYRYYGGRGITICPEWDDFATFYADMGARPSPKHSIDRIDNAGPYSPENCRWATPLEQSRNRRNVYRLTYGGESLSVREWAERLGTNEKALRARLQHGWSVERTLSQPFRSRRCLTHNGRTLPASEWAAETGIPLHVIHHRLGRGWSDARTLTTPLVDRDALEHDPLGRFMATPLPATP